MARKFNRTTFGDVPANGSTGSTNGRLSEFRSKGRLFLKLSDSVAMDTAGKLVDFTPARKVKVLA